MIPVLKLNEQPPFQASKWLQAHVLLDVHELKNLFDELGNFFLVRITGVTAPGEGLIPVDEFIKVYSAYVGRLKEGKVPEKDDYCNLFNFAMTRSLDDLFAAFVAEDKQLIRIRRPVIQIQEHTLDYSPFDHKFRSMVLGTDCITWGLQFSIPQLFQKPENNEVVQVLTSGEYPNGALFRSLQKWMRRHTMPTPFEVEGGLIKTSVRLGKDCLDWINRHPQLQNKNIKVSQGS
jgi:hypothetical protein